MDHPAFRYYGGKWRIGKWIASKFPEHVCYIEPFGGAASVLLQKRPSLVEIYNDSDNQVVNFFQVLRERESDLIRAVELTPWSRQEYEKSFLPSEEPLESARRFYVRQWQSISASESCPGWRNVFRRGQNVTRQWNDSGSNLWAIASRLKQVQIENQDALKLIQRTDTADTLYYIDPPYVPNTRAKNHRKAYRHEFSDEQHEALAKLLNKISGMAVVSGYDCELYDDLYKGWEKVSIKTTKNFGIEASETLWLSPSCQKDYQLCLFDQMNCDDCDDRDEQTVCVSWIDGTTATYFCKDEQKQL